MGAIVTDEDKEKNSKEELSNANEVEKLWAAEERHVSVGLAVKGRLSRGKKLLDIGYNVGYRGTTRSDAER